MWVNGDVGMDGKEDQYGTVYYIITFEGWTPGVVNPHVTSCLLLGLRSLAVSGQSKTSGRSNILFTRTIMPPGGVHWQSDSHREPVTHSDTVTGSWFHFTRARLDFCVNPRTRSVGLVTSASEVWWMNGLN